MTIQPYEPPATEVAVSTAGVDSWVPVLAAVGDLAAKIAGTDFVPEAMRGKPAAVAAAILAGREMGIGPMTALQNIHVIKGKPGQSAQLMRSLVLAAGHSIHYIETTDSRCVVEGRRMGEDEWERVTFTADQARKAKIDLGAYPEDKLVARATARLCRRKFADCLAGMAYSIEELQDGDADDTTASVNALPSAAPQAPRRTAKRAAPAKPEQSVTTATRAEAKAAPMDTVPPPPLPGEEEPAEATDDAHDADDDAGVSRPQLAKMHAAFNEMGITDRAERLEVTRSLLSRDGLISANELTKKEASVLIDLLEQCAGEPDPAAALHALAGIGAIAPDAVE
jgi:hypothetical protein